jgi:hypothetical protein
MSQSDPHPAPPATAAHNGGDSNPDFKPYLEASTNASQRTRSTVYVLVVAVVIIFIGYRQTVAPDWLDLRLAQFQLASACRKERDETTERCKKAIDYSRGFLFTGSADEVRDKLYQREFDDELTEQINVLMRLRTEATSLPLPFVGVVMDANDLGLVGGMFLTSILYILHAWLYRDVNNLKRAMKKAGAPASKRKEHLEQLLMAQVLTSRRGFTVGVYLLLVSVAVIHTFVYWSDRTTIPTAIILQGPEGARFETILDMGFFGLVLILSLLCGLQQWKLDDTVDKLILEVDGPKVPLKLLIKTQLSKLRNAFGRESKARVQPEESNPAE